MVQHDHTIKQTFVFVLGMTAVLAMSACSGSTATIVVTPTTILMATKTPAPLIGECNAADFPLPISTPPSNTGGNDGTNYGSPIADLQFPPASYYTEGIVAAAHLATAGPHFYRVCSPGNPMAILAFMRQSLAVNSWKIISTAAPTPDPMTIVAEKPTTTPMPRITAPAYCSTLNISVGVLSQYPGEWSFSWTPPASPCDA